ncbi:uncharacterized protein LOC135207390 [Macrobrachium nipponense]|uniref:uncharacterized protein LOC135207390 n=1 Tax=Macrobrachium nipponense TaxID=159736 RepID=UPI0030C7AEF9
MPEPVEFMGSSSGGPICDRNYEEVTDVLLSSPRPSSSRSRCLPSRLDGPRCVRLSPVQNSRKGYEEVQGESRHETDSHSPLLAGPRLVHRGTGMDSRHTKNTSSKSRSTQTASLQQVSQEHPRSGSDCVQTIERLVRARGFSKEAAKAVARARRSSTIKVYQAKWETFRTNKFEPMGQASLRDVSKKTIFLVALATAKRVSELQAISKHVGWKHDKAVCSFQEDFLAKNENPSHPWPRSFEIMGLSDLVGQEQERVLCPIRALHHYLEITRSIRGTSESLWCSVKDPSRAMTKNAIAFFLRELIKESHMLCQEENFGLLKFKAHEVRAVATSLAFKRNMALKDIIETTFWRTNSVFASHYLGNVKTTFDNCQTCWFNKILKNYLLCADAGFDMQGLSFDEKKAILAMVEESRKSAQEEENQRKQLQEREDLILKETLNKSSHLEEVKKGNDADSPDKTEEKVVIGNSKTPLCNEGDEAGCNSDSRSSTPDLLPQLPESPSKSTGKQFSTPIRSSSNASVLAQQSPNVSEDFFMFSQGSSRIGVDENVIKNCIETIRVSESESEDDDQPLIPIKSCSSPRPLPCSKSVKTQTPSKQTQSGARNFNDSYKKSPFSAISPVQPRPSLRRFQSEGTVITPESKMNEPENECISSSQPSVDAKKSHLRRLIDNQGSESIISPIVGQRRALLFSDKLSLTKNKEKTIKDSDSETHVDDVKLIPASPELMSDDETSESEAPLSNEKPLLFKDGNGGHLSIKNKTYEREVAQNSLKRKLDLLESDEIDSREQHTGSPEKVVAGKPISEQPFFQGLSMSDSEEESKEQSEKKGENVNVFSVYKNDITLKRKFGKLENPEKAYFRNGNETSTSAYKRILNMINQYFVILDSHQKTLSRRMPWSAPIKVDKRVKDSLDPPKFSKRQVEEPQVYSDEETSRMVTRHSQRKNPVGFDEMLPDISENKGMWLDAKKRNTKRRAVQLNSSRKVAKLNPEQKFGVINDALISELDDFDLPSTRLPRLSPSIEQEEMSKELSPAVKLKGPPPESRLSPVVEQKSVPTLSRLSPAVKGPGNHVEYSRKEDKVTSPSKTKVGHSNFDIGGILLSSQEDECVMDPEKGNKLTSKNRVGITLVSELDTDCQPSTSGWKNSSRRPRKTFSLTVDSDEDSSQNSENSVTLLGKANTSQIPESSLLVKNVSKAQDTKGEKNSDVLTKESKGFAESSQKVDSNKVTDISITSRFGSVKKQGKSKQVQIKPGPLRLKNQQGRSRGKEAAVVADRSDSEDSVELPVLASSHTSQQVPVSQEEIPGSADNGVECPLCSKTFPSDIIEAHASNCGEMGMEEDPVPVGDQVRGNRKQVTRKGDLAKEASTSEEVIVSKFVSRRNKRERTPPHFARCVHCSSIIKEGDEYLIHVQNCQKKMEESFDMPSRIKTPKREQNGTSSNRRVARPVLTEVSSVFDQLEG